jgi:uncharacterized protein (DUF305 family)
VSDVTGVTTPDATQVHDPGAGRADPPGAGRGHDDRRRGPAAWQIVVLALVVVFVAGVVGWGIGNRGGSDPGKDSVDVGFFYDMSAHHQQALTMALDYIRNGNDPRLLQMAREIVTYQSSEIGAMNTYLTQWGRLGDEPALAMGWMQPPVPRSQMPGLATNAQMAQLAAARGSELDDLFTRLMIDHHAGGIHMAAYAANHAEKKSTRNLAAAMDDGQRGEISEMNTWRTQHGLKAVVPPLAKFADPIAG